MKVRHGFTCECGAEYDLPQSHGGAFICPRCHRVIDTGVALDVRTRFVTAESEAALRIEVWTLADGTVAVLTLKPFEITRSNRFKITYSLQKPIRHANIIDVQFADSLKAAISMFTKMTNMYKPQ